MNRRGSVWLALFALGVLLGCSSSPWAGNWNGIRKPATGKMQSKQHGYSETKPSLSSSLVLNGNGTYTAKFEEIDYAGAWTINGQTITLKPKTYMGMERATFPTPKGSTSPASIDALFRAYQLVASTDGKTLTHTDKLGVVTFTKSG